MSELSDRVARLEEAAKHVATKADIAKIEGQLDILIWAIPLVVAVVTLLVQYYGPHRKHNA